jgi:hypothetical protein
MLALEMPLKIVRREINVVCNICPYDKRYTMWRDQTIVRTMIPIINSIKGVLYLACLIRHEDLPCLFGSLEGLMALIGALMRILTPCSYQDRSIEAPEVLFLEIATSIFEMIKIRPWY